MKIILSATKLEPGANVSVVRQELAAVLLSQVPGNLYHRRDGLFDRDRPFDVRIDLVEGIEHEFAHFRVASDCLSCSGLALRSSIISAILTSICSHPAWAQ